MGPRILCAVVLFFYFFETCYGYTATEVYNSLKDDEKGHFLRFYIAKGVLDSRPFFSRIYPGINFPDDLPIPEDLAETLQEIKIEPADFPVQLMKKFTTKYNLTSDEALLVARKRCNCVPRDKYLCMPNGQCLDLGDVGSVCCT